MNRRILSAISLSRKAGKLLLGFDVVKEAIEDKTAKLIVLASDLSPKTQKEIQRLADFGRVRVVILPHTMDEIDREVGKRAGVLAICDQGLAQMLAKLLPEDEKEEPTL